MLISKKFEKLFKTKEWKYKKIEQKLIHITLPRMEDKPKSLNTQREKVPLIKLGDS